MATQRQVDAADPDRSTWLAANAGSGKTRVLTDRVARLLFSGVRPQNILCLTYTKAAAAEMQNRLFERLGSWAMLPDTALAADLRKLGVVGAFDKTDLDRARTLFASAVETPGGLKIQTIHSFCASLLRRFPLEAGVSPQFTEIEERAADILRAEVLDAMAQGDRAHLVQDFLNTYTGAKPDDVTRQIVSDRDWFTGDFPKEQVLASLGLREGADETVAFAMAVCPDDKQTAESMVEVFAPWPGSYLKTSQQLAALNFAAPGHADLKVLFKEFLYAKDKSSKVDSFPTKNHTKAIAAMEPIAPQVHDWINRTLAAYQYLQALRTLDQTRALYGFGGAFLAAYEARKTAIGALDFDDLIRKARDLLSDKDVTNWVLFRLDGGIDHVLVDEAQDTSPAQWAVIRHLTAEFAAGSGARSNVRRTVFVVGDKKQSIYSFQGADPAEFDRMQNHFATALAAVGDALADHDLIHSFRSSPAILRVVDNTFVGARAEGLGSRVQHIAFNDDLPGRVDIWPVIEDDKAKADDPPWYAPVDQVSDAHHDVQLAQRIAAEIKRMIAHDTLPEKDAVTGVITRRKVTPGDFLILVRRRKGVFEEVIRACKMAQLDVAGADKLRVGAELAVRDLAALLQFVALPEDDLALACALRSPLFGWSEQDLYTLAQGRPEGGFLWPALRDSTGQQATLDILHDLMRQADFLRPYDLIARILTRHDGRRRLLARLGTEAEDGIDALLAQALSYESGNVPSLTGFLGWMETDALEVKRQMDRQGDKIRVMTVHGAKGLEAPIVILPDTKKIQEKVRENFVPAGDHLLWKTAGHQLPQALQDAKQDIIAADDRESMRLLYVAATRAEKWLIICGAGKISAGDESWYSVLADGVEQSGAIDVAANGQTLRRVMSGDWDAGPMTTVDVTKPGAVAAPVFDALPVVMRPVVLSPSDLGGAKVLPGDPSEGDLETALARGQLVHLLLEHLPAMTAQDRRAAGARLVASLETPVADADTLVDDVVALLGRPDLAHLFAPGALAEVGVSADVAVLGGRIFGAIDRLIIDDARVLAIDFKTNRLVPDTPDAVPEGVLRQMGAYRHALLQIYPDRAVDTAILWTQTGQLMPLPGNLVSAALARVTAP